MLSGELPFSDADICFARTVACIAGVGASGVESCAGSVEARTAADSAVAIDTCQTHAAGEDVVCIQMLERPARLKGHAFHTGEAFNKPAPVVRWRVHESLLAWSELLRYTIEARCFGGPRRDTCGSHEAYWGLHWPYPWHRKTRV